MKVETAALKRTRMFILATFIMSLALLPHVADAQSADGSDPATVNTPSEAVTDDSTVDEPAPAPSPTPTLQPQVPAVQATVTARHDDKLGPFAAGWHLLPDAGWQMSHLDVIQLSDSWRVVDAVNRTRSPAGASLFSDARLGRGYYQIPCTNGDCPAYAAVQLLRLAPARLVTYQFTCGADGKGQCTGSATDVWLAMPTEQRHEYLASVLAADTVRPTDSGVTLTSLVELLGEPWTGAAETLGV